MRAVVDFSSSQPAATASSGFRSITQKMKRPHFRAVNNDPSTEMSGGDVNAMTTSKRGRNKRRNAHTTRKPAKVKTRRSFDDLPRATDGTRIILTPFQFSRRAKRISGLS